MLLQEVTMTGTREVVEQVSCMSTSGTLGGATSGSTEEIGDKYGSWSVEDLF